MGSTSASEDIDAGQHFDVRVLRALAQRWNGRLERPKFLGFVVVAAQLCELVLRGAVGDVNDGPDVSTTAESYGDRMDHTVARLRDLTGWRWDQLFWRGGIDVEACLDAAVGCMVERSLWTIERSGWRGRSIRYIDQLPAKPGQLARQPPDGITTDRRDPDSSSSTLSVLTALYRLGLGPDGQSVKKWLPAASIVDDPQLPDSQKDTLLKIIGSAQQPFYIVPAPEHFSG